MVESPELLNITGLTKSYGNEVKALQNVALSLHRGEFVSVIGSSGAGKSTFLRCINRLIDPTEGSIVFNGEELTTMKKRELRRVRRGISMIFQHYNLVYRATAIENVLQGRLGYKSNLQGIFGLYTEEEKRQAFEILDKVGLADFAYTRADQLSGGQKQRVGIARALVQEPLLMLCDEPIASLDPKASRTTMEMLRWASDELGVACLVNLHQVDYAIEFSDRIIGLKKGKLVFDGTPDELDARTISELYGTPYYREDEHGSAQEHMAKVENKLAAEASNVLAAAAAVTHAAEKEAGKATLKVEAEASAEPAGQADAAPGQTAEAPARNAVLAGEELDAEDLQRLAGVAK